MKRAVVTGEGLGTCGIWDGEVGSIESRCFLKGVLDGCMHRAGLNVRAAVLQSKEGWPHDAESVAVFGSANPGR